MIELVTDKTKIIESDTLAIEQACRALNDGKLVSLPTETVYGLAADATNDAAVAAIFATKGRPQFNPLIVHVADIEAAGKIAVLEGSALDLAKHFWPGPMTLVLPRRADSGLSLLVSAGLETIAVRVPSHPVARALLSTFSKPIAAPSANISGRISPTRAAHVANELEDKIALVLDGGPCTAGIESTIVRAGDDCVELLRPGTITPARIEAAINLPVVTPKPGANPSAPGQLKSHYAPAANLRLNATDVDKGEALLAFGNPLASDGPTLNLSPSANLTEAAANLFAMLRELDATGIKTIAVMPVPGEELGLAINDRLTRAAAPRDESGRDESGRNDDGQTS